MPRRRKDLIFEESLFNNMEDYEIFKGRLFDLACGCFNFENLDLNIDKRFIIKKLILEGQLLAFEDPDLMNYEGKPTFFLYPFFSGGRMNEYMLPTVRRVVFANNGASYTRDANTSVILRVNISGTSLYRVIEYFARTLYLINRTIQINVNAQKTPVALVCDEDTRLSYENLLKEYMGNAPVIFGNKSLDISNLKSISLQAPYVADRLYELRTNLWNEFLTFFGIPNISISKKERMISDEVTRNMGGILVARQNFENMILDDIEKINRRFNKDIKFVWGIKDDYLEDEKQDSYNKDDIGKGDI